MKIIGTIIPYQLNDQHPLGIKIEDSWSRYVFDRIGYRCNNLMEQMSYSTPPTICSYPIWF